MKRYGLFILTALTLLSCKDPLTPNKDSSAADSTPSDRRITAVTMYETPESGLEFKKHTWSYVYGSDNKITEVIHKRIDPTNKNSTDEKIEYGWTQDKITSKSRSDKTGNTYVIKQKNAWRLDSLGRKVFEQEHYYDGDKLVPGDMTEWEYKAKPAVSHRREYSGANEAVKVLQFTTPLVIQFDAAGRPLETIQYKVQADAKPENLWTKQINTYDAFGIASSEDFSRKDNAWESSSQFSVSRDSAGMITALKQEKINLTILRTEDQGLTKSLTVKADGKPFRRFTVTWSVGTYSTASQTYFRSLDTSPFATEN